jgi:hypothetical protein
MVLVPFEDRENPPPADSKAIIPLRVARRGDLLAAFRGRGADAVVLVRSPRRHG